MSKITNDGLTV